MTSIRALALTGRLALTLAEPTEMVSQFPDGGVSPGVFADVR
jgi:hypothetical protein